MDNVARRPRNRFNFRGSLCMPYFIFMMLFVVFPLFIIVAYAFTDANWNFTVRNWGDVFMNGTNWKVIGQTIIIATITTILCIVIAYPIAYLLSNKKYNKNKVLVYIFLLPMWINFVVRTIGLKALINWYSTLSETPALTSTIPYITVVIGMVYDYLPFAILPLYNQMLKMDKNQIEAAADLGANPVQVFTRSIIPMTIPGIVSACMMTFMPTMSSYVIADKLSEGNISIIGTLIDQQFLGNTSAISNHVGATISLVMLMIVGISLLAEKAFSKKDETKKKGGIW